MNEDNKVKDVLEEYFNEVEREIEAINEVTIAEEKKDGLEIQVEPDGETDRGWSDDPYFKVYKDKRKYVARIYITRVQYCKDHKGPMVFTLNSSERKLLIKILSKNNYEKWNKIVERASYYCRTRYHKDFPSQLDMPDYSKL